MKALAAREVGGQMAPPRSVCSPASASDDSSLLSAYKRMTHLAMTLSPWASIRVLPTAD